MNCRKILLACACFATVAIFSTAAGAQYSSSTSGQYSPSAGGENNSGNAAGAEKLGTVSFPTSCNASAQSEFLKGVALLHSFQYTQAATAFQNAAKKDPHCAIAHWGMAMARWHALWEQPDGPTRERGWADAEKARSLGAKTQRERDYIAAATALYRNPEKSDYAARAAAYSDAMEQVHQKYPNDGEAAAFYALSLLALPAPDSASDLANRKKAVAILQTLLAEQPDHPGAAHYLIHACDTPPLAAEGLDAARRYAKIAPSSAHALHMPSHIFTRLGLWQESIDSNLASAAAAREATLQHLEEPGYQIHAMDFLEYAYLQSGREAEARRVIADLAAVPGETPSELAYTKAEFEARAAIELHRWRDAASLEVPAGAPRGSRETIFWARTVGEARGGDAATARKNLQELKTVQAEWRAENPTAAPTTLAAEQVYERKAEAWVIFAEGKTDDALKFLRETADQEDVIRPELMGVPAREMLGDMLLELKQPAEALAAYQASLKEAPNRFNSLYGAGRAAELASQAADARTYYAKLLAVSDHAPAGRPELQHAKLFLEAKAR